MATTYSKYAEIYRNRTRSMEPTGAGHYTATFRVTYMQI